LADFGIVALRIGGGTAGLGPLPMSSADRLRVLEFRPDLVVSLTGLPEMSDLGAPDLQHYLTGAGFAWTGFPVPDFGIPTRGQDWPTLSHRQHALLDNGGRVLAHCRGGCGRSGMILLRLMVEAGEDPEAALIRLRQVRPCAVETDEQLAWAVTA